MNNDVPGGDFLELEFPVEVWLASEELRLGDLLDLKTGDVLPLSGNPEESVDVVANGVTLASGELVVVEGKFGVRITATPTQKLANIEAAPPGAEPTS